MDKTFRKFLQSGIDLSPAGVEQTEDNYPYFCTPKGANIFGWAGVDGIHFCFVRGFGGTVFAVSPMNCAPDFVHPIARDFADFLRLLSACGSTAALEQAWSWDEARFEAFLRENPPTPEQQQVISEIEAKMKLTPMEHPWAYIKALQESFDYGKIKYTDDYYDEDMNPSAESAPPEWKVYFEGGFWGTHGRECAGTQTTLNGEFDWAGHRWLVPAAYSCGKGLVVDICMRTEAEDIRNFMRKWALTPENDSCDSFTTEQQLRIDTDNPLCLDFVPCAELNGKTLQAALCSAVSYNPCLPEKNGRDVTPVIEHYNLDTSYGWTIFRYSFPRNGKRRTEIKSLSLTMEQQPCRVPGQHFKIHAPGDTFTFTHPVSKTEYTLTARETEPQTISHDSADSDGWIYPTHFTVMSYTVSPEPTEDISVCDCADGDKPLKKAPDTNSRFVPEAQNDIACIGIIGGADGPTAVILGHSKRENLRAVCSALHFEPTAEDIEWRVEFRIRRFGEGRFLLK